MSPPETETDDLSAPTQRLLGQVLASISFLRQDVHRMIDRLAEGERRMDHHEQENIRRRAEIKALELITSAPARKTDREPASSWARLASALSDVAREWGETLKLAGRIVRWVLLGYLAFSLNHGEFVTLAKSYLMRDQEASDGN